MLPPISSRTRIALRERLVGWTLAEITDLFEAEGLIPVPVKNELSGARRSLAAEYLESIDWEQNSGRRRFLRVAEQLIDAFAKGDNHEPARDDLLILLQRDGYRRDSQGSLRPSVETMLLELPTDPLMDATAVELELDRLVRDWDRDAGQVIDAAKRLVEAVCKRILADRDAHTGMEGAPALTALVARTLQALELHPTQLDADRWGTDVDAAARRVLGGLSAVTDGLATLRNRVGGHGHASARTLPPRWGHLAAGAAATLCRMLLETHQQRAFQQEEAS